MSSIYLPRVSRSVAQASDVFACRLLFEVTNIAHQIDSPTHIPSSASPSVPVTPGITPSSLPLSSPGHESASTSHVLSSSPPTRRSRPKPKETPQAGQASQETSRPQLVEYIKQIHGLTKKRTPGGKAAKKTGAAEQARASSSRPILPRLELPPSNLSVDPKGKATERAALEAASSGGSRYAAIAPAGPARSAAPEEGHRAQSQSPRRWPWLQPATVPSATPVEERELSPSAAAALRNLQTIAPRLPGMGTHLPGEQHSPPRARRAATYDTHTSQSEETVSTSTSLHRQATYPAPGMSPPPQSGRMHSSQAYHTVAGDYHYIMGTVTHNSPQFTGSQVSQTYAAEHYSGYTPQQYPTFTSPTGHGGMISSSPLPAQDDPENLPFVITAEYEALANAEFEQAVRSGAMQASMTPTALSPVVTSPGMHPAATGYFPSEPVGSGNIMSPSMQQTPTTQTQQTGSGYTSYHPSQQEQHLTGEVVYHQSHGQSPPGTRGPPSSSPPGPMQYYNPDSPPGNDPSQARRWYG